MRDQWGKVILFASSRPLQGRAAAESWLGSASRAGDEESSNGAAGKPFDALAEMVFNLKEKSFWSERMHPSPWARVQ